MAYRFVHTADIHLDSPLRSLALRNAELAELVGNATRRALSAIVDLCLAEGVDALLLAGDLYDGDQTSMKTARFLAGELHRLHEAGIRVFVIRGNHDALSKITRELTLPETVKLFGGRAEAVEIARGARPIIVHGLSFSDPKAPESLLPKYRPPVEGAINIGLMHTSLAGAAGHDPYAPCSLADLGKSGFRYWALGHIHKRAVTTGSCTVVMPGNPQGRDINEAGVKSVSLVTVGDDGAIAVEERPVGVAQFERVVVDVAGILEWPDLVEALAGALQRARETCVAQHFVARVEITGATPLAWRLRRDADLLKTEADHHAERLGRSWVETIELRATAAAAGRDASDPLAELRRLITGDVAPSESFRHTAESIAAELMKQLPPECRDLLGADLAAHGDRLAGLATEGADEVLAHLRAEADRDGA